MTAALKQSRSETTTAYENPLIPNARLRQIYLAMLQARMLTKLPGARRLASSAAGIEACLVSPAINLTADDLVLDAGPVAAASGAAVRFLRGAGLAEVIAPAAKPSRARPILAECGHAASVVFPNLAAPDRLWAAVGAASCLRAIAQTKPATQPTGDPAESPSEPRTIRPVAVLYVHRSELSGATGRRVLSFAGEHTLPLIFVVLPGAAVGNLSATAAQCGVPGIPVDADDAVALYRVAQESIGRARIGGGPALLECVPYALPSAVLPSRKVAPKPDALTTLENYLLQRHVVSQSWFDREARKFARLKR